MGELSDASVKTINSFEVSEKLNMMDQVGNVLYLERDTHLKLKCFEGDSEKNDCLEMYPSPGAWTVSYNVYSLLKSHESGFSHGNEVYYLLWSLARGYDDDVLQISQSAKERLHSEDGFNTLAELARFLVVLANDSKDPDHFKSTVERLEKEFPELA